MGKCSGSRGVLFLLNVIFWACGGFLLFGGIVFVNKEYGSLAQVNVKPAVFIICAACILLLGGVIGCVGAFTEKKGCLSLYLIFLSTVLIIMAVLTGLMMANKSEADKKFDTFLWDQFNLYGSGNRTVVVDGKNVTATNGFNATIFIDNLQKQFECCGYNNFSDWRNLPWSSNVTVPLSCCKDDNNLNTTCVGDISTKQKQALIYSEGCSKQLDQEFTYYYTMLSWTSFTISVLTLLGVLIVIAFLCKSRNHAFSYSGLGPGYTTV